MGFLFEKLEVYQRALELVGHVHKTTARPSKGYSHLVNQLRRAATSVPLNIAEGYGRYNPKEKRRFYLIARGSCYECVAALEVSRRSGAFDAEDSAEARRLLEETSRMLTKLIQVTEAKIAEPSAPAGA